MNLWLGIGLAPAGFLAGWLLAPLTGPYAGAPSRERRLLIAGVLAVVCALLGWRLGATVALVAYLYLGAVGTLLTFIDIAVKRLPDPFTLPSYLAGTALLAAAAPFVDDGWPRLVYALIGMACLWLVYGIQHFLLPNAIGRGDVKLAGVLGLYLGWFGQSTWLAGLFLCVLFGGVVSIALLMVGRGDIRLAWVLGVYLGLSQSTWYTGLLLGVLFGGVVTIALMVIRRSSRRSEIPYGPFMLTGALAAVLAHPGVTL